MMEGYHISVLLAEVLKYLQVKEGRWYLDCTLGDGGHSLEILRLGGNLIGLDQDPEALKRVGERFSNEAIKLSSYKLIRGNFGRISELIEDIRFDGILMDLGVSSLQLDDPTRGFSFNKEAPLDMRMDPEMGVRALDLVNGLNKGELLKLFTKFGESADRRVIEAIINARSVGGVNTTTQLASIIQKAVKGGGRDRIHPATTYFQALRIAVNDELNNLTDGLRQAEERLSRNGTILVISFHSLEDRVVKNLFRKWAGDGLGEVVTSKPIVPSEEEVRANPRSRSAKLRVFKKG